MAQFEVLQSEELQFLYEGNKDGALYFIAWTTTPWTLPANQAVCLHPDFDYAVLQVDDEAFIIAVGLEEAFAKACKIEKFEVLGKKKGKSRQKDWVRFRR